MWRSFVFDRNMIRNVWRYQINIATDERLRVVDRLLIGRESIYVLLRRERLENCSASAELTSLKGPAEVAARDGRCLRSALGNDNIFLNKVHIPDDTADFLRELSIFFPYEVRVHFIDSIISQPSNSFNVTKLVRRFELKYPHRQFDAILAANALHHSVASCTDMSSQQIVRVREEISAAAANGGINHEVIDLFHRYRAVFNEWDVLVFLTQYVTANRKGVSKLLAARLNRRVKRSHRTFYHKIEQEKQTGNI
jgi:hypothetical protein